MELLDIGKELKAARENKGISLEKAHEDTRIGFNFLKSLEEGKVEHITYPVYARGFVRGYAKYLGLDSERIGNDFSSVFKDEDRFDQIDQNDLPTSLKGPRQILRSQSNALILGTVLALIVFSGLGWFLYSLNRSGSPEQELTAFSHDPVAEAPYSDGVAPHDPGLPREMPFADDEPVPGAPDPEALTEEVPSEHAEDVVSLEPSSLPETPGRPALDGEAENGLPVAAEQSAVLEQETLAPVAPDQSEVRTIAEKSTIVIRASEDCWLRVLADESSREAYLRPGESMTVEFEELVQITLGNAGGVDIFLNGVAYPFEASSGQVKTLRITSPEINSP